MNRIQWPKVFEKVKAAFRAHRPWDTRTSKKDRDNNYRLDMGVVKNGLVHVLVQANKEAKDKSVREAAAKHGHAVIAEAPIDPAEDPDEEKAKESLIADFKKKRDLGDKELEKARKVDRNKKDGKDEEDGKEGKGGKGGKGGDKGGKS